jgi:thymidylate synthase (FAD)
MKLKLISDPYFEVELLNSTPNAKEVLYNILGISDLSTPLIKVVDRNDFVKVLEFIDLTLSVEGFPHSVAMQARTHRIGVTFDIQSSRYTGKRVIDVADGVLPIEQVFYFRPVGTYKDRQGNNYTITAEQIAEDVMLVLKAIHRYKLKILRGESEEAARDILPQGIRQNFVMSINARYLIHMLDLRLKLDTQPEFQTAAYGMLMTLDFILPELYTWYQETRLGKAILTP